MSKIKRLCIIPARSGSKRIKNKNIKNFHGKPMVYWPYKTAMKSNLFDEIHISTESASYIKILKEIKIHIKFKRPKSLSNDYTSSMAVLKHTVKEFIKNNQYFDQIFFIYPCSPLIEVKDLLKAERVFRKLKIKTGIISVGEFSSPIQWAYMLNTKNKISPLMPKYFNYRSQDLEQFYYDSGNFGIFDTDYILNSNFKNLHKEIYGYKISKYKAIDIDDIEDWKIAEKLFNPKS